MSDNCPVCKKFGKVNKQTDSWYIVDCPCCGKFHITEEAYEDLPSLLGDESNYHLLRCILRNRFEDDQKIYVDREYLTNFMKTFPIPRGVIETMYLFIQHLSVKAVDGKDKFIPIYSRRDFPLIFAKSYDEFKFYIEKMIKMGLIEKHEPVEEPNDYALRLTIKGWNTAERIARTSPAKSRQAFVAMWFDESMDDAWSNGFEVALSTTGYKPIRIDKKEHVNNIVDEILVDIRSSRLFVADFTNQRQGVYFEAGYALGNGIPVIWTCREDDLSKLHFDIKQYNHIVWKNTDDLRGKLTNRVNALFPLK